MARAYVYEDDSSGWRQMVESDMPNSGVTAATYGDSTHVSQVQVNAQGFVTSASNVAIAAAGGTAGGDLTGTYPNPTVANVSELTTKGDLLVGAGSSVSSRLAIGSNTQILTADSTQTLGMKWAAASSAGVSSFAQQGQTALTGAVTISPGAGVTMSEVGQNIAISSTASGSGSTDGWLDDTAETWTFATANTFTVSGDVTTKYTVGTRIKLTQTTVKFFQVSANPVFAAGSTTVTITGGTSYTFANAAVSANYHSYVVNPQGWPTWFTWTPSPSGYSGSPTVVARFCTFGRTCTFYIDVTGTSNATTSTFTIPIAMGPGQTDDPFFLISFGNDNSVRLATPGNIELPASGTTATTGKAMNAGGGWTNSGTKAYLATITYEI